MMSDFRLDQLHQHIVPPTRLFMACAFDERRSIGRLYEDRVDMAGNLLCIGYLNHIRHVNAGLWYRFGLCGGNESWIIIKKPNWMNGVEKKEKMRLEITHSENEISWNWKESSSAPLEKEFRWFEKRTRLFSKNEKRWFSNYIPVSRSLNGRLIFSLQHHGRISRLLLCVLCVVSVSRHFVHLRDHPPNTSARHRQIEQTIGAATAEKKIEKKMKIN